MLLSQHRKLDHISAAEDVAQEAAEDTEYVLLTRETLRSPWEIEAEFSAAETVAIRAFADRQPLEEMIEET